MLSSVPFFSLMVAEKDYAQVETSNKEPKEYVGRFDFEKNVIMERDQQNFSLHR